MFSLFIEEKFKGIGVPLLTDIFIVLILLVFILALVSSKYGVLRRFTTYAPTLLTSLGILGTFAGIISGLLEFDTDSTKIDASIPLLLEGLKTAFISSLVGMSASIIYKVATTLPIMTPKKAPKTKESFGAYDVYQVMKVNNEILENIEYALGGNSNNSVANQLTLVRSQLIESQRETSDRLTQVLNEQKVISNSLKESHEKFNEFQNQLWKELHDFAEMLSESASKHLIEALNDIISDFNQNLTEQFGDNFKKLNEAVGKLIDWQVEYKQQILQMNDQYQLGVKAIAETSQQVANIESSSEKIPENMEKMTSTMQLLQRQLNDVEEHVKRMGTLHEKAEEMHPAFKKRLEEVVTASIDANQLMEKSMVSTARIVDSSITNFSEQTNNTFDEMTKSSNKLFEGMNLSIETSIQKNTESINEQMKKIEEGQGQEIERLTIRMGQALTSITDHFTQDYKRLVDAMQQITQYGNRG